jgi:very-short-patch-repair endonuclease
MIFSPVVAKSIPQGARYYLENTPNLFNVAITRARSRLIVVGNKSACLNCGIAHISAFAKYVNYLAEGAKKRTKMNRCETEYEEILFSALKENGIVALPQYIVGQDRLDFAIFNNNLKLDVEVDGVTTHIEYTGERVKQDIKRNLRLQNQVWKVLRFWNYEIRDNLDYCIKQIKDQLVLY